MSKEFSKIGHGAHAVTIEDDGQTKVVYENQQPRTFNSVREAYDNYRGMTQTDHTSWNICYGLEDYL